MKSLKSKLMAAGVMVMISAVMLTSASFAWFTVSTAPEVTSVQVEMTATKNLEIAKATDKDTAPSEVSSNDTGDETKWGGKISSFSGGQMNFPATIPAAGSANAGKLMTIGYDNDGRTKTANMVEASMAGGTLASGATKISANVKINDTETTSKDVAVVYACWLRSNNDMTVDVSVDASGDAVTVKKGADKDTATDLVGADLTRVKASVKAVPATWDSTGSKWVIDADNSLSLTANTPTLVGVIVYLEGETTANDQGTLTSGIIAKDVGEGTSLWIDGVKVSFAEHTT